MSIVPQDTFGRHYFDRQRLVPFCVAGFLILVMLGIGKSSRHLGRQSLAASVGTSASQPSALVDQKASQVPKPGLSTKAKLSSTNALTPVISTVNAESISAVGLSAPQSQGGELIDFDRLPAFTDVGNYYAHYTKSHQTQ